MPAACGFWPAAARRPAAAILARASVRARRVRHLRRRPGPWRLRRCRSAPRRRWRRRRSSDRCRRPGRPGLRRPAESRRTPIEPITPASSLPLTLGRAARRAAPAAGSAMRFQGHAGRVRQVRVGQQFGHGGHARRPSPPRPASGRCNAWRPWASPATSARPAAWLRWRRSPPARSCGSARRSAPAAGGFGRTGIWPGLVGIGGGSAGRGTDRGSHRSRPSQEWPAESAS